MDSSNGSSFQFVFLCFRVLTVEAMASLISLQWYQADFFFFQVFVFFHQPFIVEVLIGNELYQRHKLNNSEAIFIFQLPISLFFWNWTQLTHQRKPFLTILNLVISDYFVLTSFTSFINMKIHFKKGNKF